MLFLPQIHNSFELKAIQANMFIAVKLTCYVYRLLSIL